MRDPEKKPKDKLEIEPSKTSADSLRVEANLKTDKIGKEVLNHRELAHFTDEHY